MIAAKTKAILKVALFAEVYARKERGIDWAIAKETVWNNYDGYPEIQALIDEL
jgi:hypothetical protein